MSDPDPRNPQIEKLLRDIAQNIGAQIPEGFGFTLLIFGYGDDESMFYISSAQRNDMVKAMREFIQKQGPN